MRRLLIILAVVSAFITTSAIAEINRVRVVNDTDKTIYIHLGGFAPSKRIEPGKWKIFYYPFEITPPGSNEKVKSTKIIASSGGRWMTTPNGFTYLSKPDLLLCLDYAGPAHKDKSGNRVWTIKSAKGFDKNCKIKGYKQPWHKKTTE